MNYILQSICSKLNWNIQSINLIPLHKGLSNKNYILTYNNTSYFLSISSNRNRIVETENLNLAASLNLAPNVVFSHDNILLTTWINGTMPTILEYNSTDFIKLLTNNLHTLHSQTSNNLFNPFKDIHLKLKYCKDNSIPIPKEMDTIISTVNRLNKTLCLNINYGLCHNDLNVSNMIIQNNNLLFIDFEYAGYCDIFYDLATISWMLTPSSIPVLLKFYFNKLTIEIYLKLKMYLYIVKVWNLTWCLCQPPNPNYDFHKSISLLLEELAV